MRGDERRDKRLVRCGQSALLAPSSKLSDRMATTMPYLRAPFELPINRFVGLLSCQCDPMLRSLQTTVLACTKSSASDPKSNKTHQSKRDAKQQVENESTFEVELADTVAFPEGGGQPWDLGVIRAEGSTAKILKVVRRGAFICLICHPNLTSVFRSLCRALLTNRETSASRHSSRSGD